VTDAATGTDPGDIDGPWPDPGPDVVRAGGGLVYRLVPTLDADEDAVELLVVHRPRYDDWSLPKGKCDAGEGFRDAALREVQEETGLTCEIDQPWAEVRYTDHKGRPKVVRYWAMTVTAGDVAGFVPNDEVDRLTWLAPTDAAAVLTYPYDIDLVARFPDT
jgi:8-oxo-dGTP diphosphatase